VKKDAAPKAPERAPAAPARGWKAHETATSIDSWLDSLALADLSQQVQMRSAVDDLVRGSELVRRSAARLLVSLGLAAEPVFVECARSASPMVVETCLESLSELGSKWLVQLLPHIAASQDEALRLVALRVVQHLALEVRKPLLLGALRDPQPTVRRRALTYLGWQHASWAKAEILRLCYDADPTVKWAALESLAAIEPAEARARLDSMYPGMDPVLRRRAVRLLERQLRPPNEGFGSPSREERPVRRPLEGKGQNG
jgi:HEAT repeat protein